MTHAKSQIKHDLVTVKMSGVVALLYRERRVWFAPIVCAEADVFKYKWIPDLKWDPPAVPRPKPDLDACVLGSAHGVPSSAVAIEWGAIRV